MTKCNLLKIFFLFTFLLSPFVFVHAATPIKILIVPGHDGEVWGAQYKNIKEADMNLRLGTELFNILKKDKRFKVYITRNSLGYTRDFADYFLDQEGINTFKENAKAQMDEKVSSGTFVEKEGPPHHDTANDIALKLYGFNKWADENKIDAVIHVHFNDYPREHSWTVGKYKGFTVYMPEEQMANAEGSDKLAKSIFTQLKNKFVPSNYPPENGGLVPDQKLIALGSNGTLDASVRSVLIEYGYIYRFGNSTFRHKAYTTMANQTATGIKNYFFNSQR